MMTSQSQSRRRSRRWSVLGISRDPSHPLTDTLFLVTGSVRIALDAMGGDHGPLVIVEGAALALARRPELAFTFFGKQSEIAPLVSARPALAKVSRIVHTDVA